MICHLKEEGRKLDSPDPNDQFMHMDQIWRKRTEKRMADILFG